MNIIKILIITVLSLLSQSSISQHKNFFYGIKAGMNYTIVDADKPYGFYAGAYGNIYLTEELKLQPEILYFRYVKNKDLYSIVRKNAIGGYWTTHGHFVSTITQSTIQVPVILQYHCSKKIYIEAGPELTFITDQRLDLVGGTKIKGEVVTNFNDEFDYGIGLGFGYKFTSLISFSTRYNLGFTEGDSIVSLGVVFRT